MSMLTYLLQVSACTAVFYLFYFACLRRLTFFSLNRWYLLLTLMASFGIPLITIPVSSVPQMVIRQPVIYQYYMEQPLQVQAITPTVAEAAPFNWIYLFTNVYYVAAVIFFLHLLVTLVVFWRRSKGQQLLQIGHIKVIKSADSLTNSSFANVVFLNDDELGPEEVRQVLAHELLHVRLMHSADRMVARIAQVVLWFNPFVYCYIRSIEENHEFEVDRIAANDAGKNIYASLLLRLSISANHVLYNSFSKAPLKKRIAMLFNQPSSNMKKIIYVLLLPLAIVSCLAFANVKGKTDEKDKRVSAVGDLRLLGPHPLVIIDEKEYKDDILYTISGRCISSSSISKSGVDKYGEKAKDGVVAILTKRRIILTMTPIEKANLLEIAAIPNGKFYSRLRLKNDDGSEYDEVFFKMPGGGSMSSQLALNEKPALVFGKKIYSEADVNKLEQMIRDQKQTTFGTGSTLHGPQPEFGVDLSGFDNYFFFAQDTVKFRQKIKRTQQQELEYEKAQKKAENFRQTDEYKQKAEQTERVMGKELPYKVVGFGTFGLAGNGSCIKLENNGYVFYMRTSYGQEKQLQNKFKIGDVLNVKVFTAAMGQGEPVQIQPATIVFNGEKIFQLAEADQIPKVPFLFEANKVRFTDGQITSITKYPNGKWKSAVVEVVNGYRIKFNIKPDAPSFEGIESGDHVRFRFIGERKTGSKEYTVNDWVTLTTDIKDYGIKNPELFSKYYEKA
ncbi:Signal transducer regulating beta-lactamase production, contains metallopeptidase domain [Mucilaginibacter gossypiicola]|uniref:Signal transducer regulating beta-lactamase production, contains metallopeptidase domain n=1 Tax=Mucilaginibacter gossypiicola TaxID=551995 RepID=A0A1H8DNP5_9SPHI|nr:M56 family metallopeptidase [Mucilaginibacter gossypiicola]SEN08816.1 Signal transducer regulating beta-lactamase production, contains metallopeptidase domain [Mucilaginibacter gossypiicola]